MVERRSGKVINISSTLGVIGIPGRTPYASTKGGLIQFTRTLALEWAPHNVNVNAICPGPFVTPLNRVLLDNPEVYQQFVSKIPFARFADPKEIHGAVIFLASEASSYVTGSCIFVDGGWTAH
jgi:NAD(P)-dependent dehydrogenase (short-subunit alcohol dehydrogenase family)